MPRPKYERKKAVKQSGPAEVKSDYTAKQIVDMHDKKRSSTAFTDLHAQIDSDFNLFSLKPYKAETDHQSYTSPKPKNDFLKVFNGVNKASLTWNIALPEDASKQDRDAANKGEQLLTGILQQADEQLSSIGEPPLRQGTGWFGCARGGVAVKCLIYNEEKTVDGKKELKQVTDIRYMDLLQMAWEKGAEGYSWVSYEYPLTKIEAKEKYKIEVADDADNPRVIDFFTKKINAVVLSYGAGDKSLHTFVKEPEPHGWDHVPVWIEFASSMPTVYDSKFGLQLKERAASAWTTSRAVYETFNKQVSFLLDLMEKNVAGSIVYASESGTKGLSGDPFKNYQEIKIKYGKEEIKPLEPPKAPAETKAILDIVDRDLNQSTVPFPIGYGLDPQAHSGTALAMINDNTRSIYDPFTNLLERAYRWLCKEILVQFKAKGQSMQLKGFNSDGKYFTLKVAPDEIQDDWIIQVKCEPKLPRDEAGELAMAIQATQGRAPFMRPLLSDLTVREKILKIQNPDAEDTRIDTQIVKHMVEQIPQVQIRRLAIELVDQNDLEGAIELLSAVPSPTPSPGTPDGTQPSQAPASGPNAVTPEILERLAAIAARFQREGKQIPPQLMAILQQASKIPAPGAP